MIVRPRCATVTHRYQWKSDEQTCVCWGAWFTELEQHVISMAYEHGSAELRTPYESIEVYAAGKGKSCDRRRIGEWI